MQRRTTVILTFIFVIILVATLYTFTDWFSRATGFFTGADEKTRLAYCLNENGAEFYTNTFCADCEKQEKLFGTAFSAIKKIDCGKNKEFCPNIREIPAWFINEKIHYGFKTLEELKTLSGCTE